jgi:hypothetical protein
MSGTLISNPWGGLIPAWLALLASLTPAAAQPPFSPAQQPGAAARNPICVRLEAQLAAVDRGNVDPARADQIKRLDDAANRQQADLDRLTAQARRLGCEGRGLFSIFMEQPQQCGQLNNQIQQLRANLDRVLADLQRAQGGTADREGQRRTILASLGQNDCGPQYRNFANNNPSGGGNFFERLFGPATTAPNSNIPELPQVANSGSYRALCVRTCDGYYFPLSSSASSRFGEDEKTCQRLCPAAETALYTQRSQGEDVSQAVSSAATSWSTKSARACSRCRRRPVRNDPRRGPPPHRRAQRRPHRPPAIQRLRRRLRSRRPRTIRPIPTRASARCARSARPSCRHADVHPGPGDALP